MYMMYVDESGDPGMVNTPTPIFVLSGVVVNEQDWGDTLEAFLGFRQRMRSAFGLKMREEIHSARFITSPGPLARIPRQDRLTILRHFSDEMAALTHLRIINVVVNKAGKPANYDPFEQAWRALVQRLENTLEYSNFPNPIAAKERGILYADGLPQAKLTGLMRKMRVYNPIANQVGGGYRNILMRWVIEDPSFRDSTHSQFIQAADLAAFLLYQREFPNKYMRKSGGQAYFTRLAPILCRVASPRDPQGIVRL